MMPDYAAAIFFVLAFAAAAELLRRYAFSPPFDTPCDATPIFITREYIMLMFRYFRHYFSLRRHEIEALHYAYYAIFR